MPSCSNKRDTFYLATIAFDDLELSLIQDELNGLSLSREPARRASSIQRSYKRPKAVVRSSLSCAT